MTTLQELFGAAPVRTESAPVLVDPDALQDVVEQTLPRQVAPATRSHARPVKPRRRRRTKDWLTFAAVAVAAVTALAAVGVATAQAMMDGPEASALRELAADEGALANDELAVEATRTALGEKLAAEQASIPALRTSLNGLDGSVDERVAAGALEALTAFETGLGAVELPEAVAPYRRGGADLASLEGIAQVADAVRERALDLVDRRTVLTEAQTAVTAVETAFDAKLAELGTAITASGRTLIENSPDAAPEFRDALAAVLAGGSGSFSDRASAPRALEAYQRAFTALSDDQLRAEEEIRLQEQREREERERREREERENDTNDPNQDGGDPPPDPNDPNDGGGEDPPTDEPTEPPVHPDPFGILP